VKTVDIAEHPQETVGSHEYVVSEVNFTDKNPNIIMNKSVSLID
jgi:hypothetical protein